MQNHKDILQKRAALFRQLRSFFYERGVLEIEAPLLASSAVTDLHIESIPAVVEWHGVVKEYYLITSPEFFMKRLLASGCGSIFYLGKVFRQNEHGSRHHHEFTMLEWYREGWDEHQLIREVSELLSGFFPDYVSSKTSYGDLFELAFKARPYNLPLRALKDLVAANIDVVVDGLTPNDCYDLLFSHCIEPRLKGITCVYDFPVSQAALAQINQNSRGESIARRFEVFIDDMELANGYFELTSPDEQRKRFAEDLCARSRQGKKNYPIDESLLAALEQGLPSCAGVALGVDRLLMKAYGKQSLPQVLPWLEHANQGVG